MMMSTLLLIVMMVMVNGDEYNTAGDDDGDFVDAFHLVTRTNTSLGLQVADQPLGVVHQLRLDSREIKKTNPHSIKSINQKMPFFQTSLEARFEPLLEIVNNQCEYMSIK